MQTQTAECLVIGQITCDRMLIVLNKTDMLPADKRAALVEKMTRRLRTTLANTKFAAADIVPVAAAPGGPDAGLPAVGLDDLMAAIGRQCFVPGNRRTAAGPALFAVDHCFAIRGQGTVMTGTVLQARLWIRIDSKRIRIQHFYSIRIRFRIQAKTELSKTISFSNFFEIKIWVKSNKKY
jgi:selenocysteine-specific elongation factor